MEYELLVDIWYRGTSAKSRTCEKYGCKDKSTPLAAALRQSKHQPTRLLWYLMVELFLQDELRCSTVQGKKGSLPGFNRVTMNAILCKLLLCIA